MKKISVLVALLISLSLVLAGSAWAAIVTVPNPGDQFWDSTAQAIAARAQNGAPGDFSNVVGTYAIGLGYTDLSTPPTDPNPLLRVAILPDSGPGALPIWSYGTTYHFTLAYVDPTYGTKFSVTGPFNDVNQTFFVADFLNEYAGIYTIRLNYGGDATLASVNISNLTLNGVTMGTGTYNSGSTNNFVYFRNSDGTPFLRNFTIAGDFVFTGLGGSANFPGFEIDLSPQVVPPSILQILAFFDKAVASGALTGEGPGNSAGGRLKAFRNMLQAAADLIAAGDMEGAYQKLREIYQKTDGDPHVPDFVEGDSAAILAQMILDLDNSLNVSISLALDPPPGGGADIFLNTADVSTVPLPPTVLLLGSGLIPLMWARRRRLGRK